MIRRNFPLTADDQQWLIVSQIEHARISHQLASAWRGLLAGAPESVHEELLAAVLHHDDGWRAWDAAPGIDPERGRPYGFTEMPPADAQAIWSRSIDLCRELGPLAGWVVASHFIDLQKKQDDDFSLWARWLGEQDLRRTEWLADWLAESSDHTLGLADEGLFLLRTFDWISLWLFCRAPLIGGDPLETLELGDEGQALGPVTFSPQPLAGGAAAQLVVEPWPFVAEELTIEAGARLAPAGRYLAGEEMPAESWDARWRLLPG